MFPLTCMLVRATIYSFAYETAGAACAPAFPAPSDLGEMNLQGSGGTCREDEEVYLCYSLYDRHPEERALARVSKGDGHRRGRSSFEARPAMQLHRKARTSG